MRPPRVARASGLLLAAAALLACDRRDVPPRADSTTDSAAQVGAPAGDANRWVPDLGTLLVAPIDSQTGVVLFPADPDERQVDSVPLTLLDASGAPAIARATLVASDSQVCGEAPVLRLRDSTIGAWSIGVVGARTVPLRMDSIEAWPAADSVRAVSEIARLASALPMRGDSPFKGLPFVVFSARRFRFEEREVLVAHVVRRVPLEAAPVEEHTLIIAERDAAQRTSWETAFHLRSEGLEDAADQYDVLAALAGRSTVWLVVARDNSARTIYQVLERSSGGWLPRWSRVLSC